MPEVHELAVQVGRLDAKVDAKFESLSDAMDRREEEASKQRHKTANALDDIKGVSRVILAKMEMIETSHREISDKMDLKSEKAEARIAEVEDTAEKNLAKAVEAITGRLAPLEAFKHGLQVASKWSMKVGGVGLAFAGFLFTNGERAGKFLSAAGALLGGSK